MIILLKIVLIYGVARVMRLSDPVSREVALLTSPGGEFAFVVVGAAVVGGALDKGLAAQVMMAVTLSMLAIPALMALADAIRPPAKADDAVPRPEPPSETNNHVIVAGFGRVGNLVGEMLDRHNIPFIAIDGDAALVGRARTEGQPIYFGDATRADFLRKCGIAKARALVVTMDAPAAADLIVTHARAERPDMTIVARARDANHASRLYALGASDAVPETVEASLQLSEAVLVDIGIPMGLVIASIHEKRGRVPQAVPADGRCEPGEAGDPPLNPRARHQPQEDRAARLSLARFPIRWNHLMDQNSRQINHLSLFLSLKSVQLERNRLYILGC